MDFSQNIRIKFYLQAFLEEAVLLNPAGKLTIVQISYYEEGFTSFLKWSRVLKDVEMWLVMWYIWQHLWNVNDIEDFGDCEDKFIYWDLIEIVILSRSLYCTISDKLMRDAIYTIARTMLNVTERQS